jgi:hypothetical protein
MRLLAVSSALMLCARALAAQNQPTLPPPAPRAFSFGDTLGAAFAVEDSVRLHGTPQDFDFLVGLWEFRFQQRRPNGEFSPAYAGHWSAQKKSNPNAFVEDHFRPDNRTATWDVGTWTYRIFNPQRSLWTMQGVGSESGQWAPGLCWSDADNRYVIQWYGTSLMRIRYFNIKPNSFQWRADRSSDGGKTWQLDWWTMEATRVSR